VTVAHATLRAGARARIDALSSLLTAQTAFAFLFLYLPIAVVIAYAFNAGRFVSIWRGFSTRWFGEAVQDAAIRAAIGTSLLIAVVSTAIATVLATMTAWQLERTGRRVRAATDAFAYMRIMLPELVVALGLLVFVLFLQSNGLGWLKLGLGTVIVGHVTWSFTYVLLVVRARLAGMDPALREAAMDLGATPLRTFRRVILPDLWPGIAAGALLAFTFSFDDFVTTFFLAGPAVATLPVQLFSMIRFGLTPEVNAISTLLFLFSLAVLGLFIGLMRLGRRS
jgi:spermidine/putrescine transport system permease protein